MEIAFNTGTVASLLALLGLLGGLIGWCFRVQQRFLTLEKHDRRDHELLMQLVRGQFATLEGLRQLGCNGEVTKAREALKNHVIDH